MYVIVCAVVALLIGGFIGYALAREENNGNEPMASPYATRLGRTCWVLDLFDGEWHECVCIAVSWHGAVCVRKKEHMDKNGFWVPKDTVGERVKWRADA